jgi:hypothetical protein
MFEVNSYYLQESRQIEPLNILGALEAVFRTLHQNVVGNRVL